MTDEVKTAAAPEAEVQTPMQRAVAGGYKPPEPPSVEDRAKAVIAALELARKHNSPIGPDVLAEAKALLLPADESADESKADDATG